MEDWKFLKENIYYCDGSFRDITIRNTTKEDWKLWADVVNKTYKTSFSEGGSDIQTGKIDIYRVYDYWDGKTDTCLDATIFIGNIVVKTYFFTDEEIENDITPKEINTIDDHINLMQYLSTISTALNKRVVLTPENYNPSIEKELIIIDNDKVLFCGL
ncbi:hypothetical protein [Mucilaginibacter gilvus]|uniref:Uncharacterized protein n=1 Tax=Mucilaginibacter gilvus TaxID=2305909 RepID=A0A3S3VDV3_9SPHI|nr:hypothetical protein [Mucilaginibacter gilvus]RWY46249.1 hypothetical protein EPL05_23165 [Mucilaginibacter gilvus]